MKSKIIQIISPKDTPYSLNQLFALRVVWKGMVL